LKIFIFENNAYTWCFISALNPHSMQMSEDENEKRHRNLVDKIKAMKWRFCEGNGIPAGDNWKPEKSVLILDISMNEAIELGKDFQQNAIVFGRLNQAPELVFFH
jgi:hypothetical protein